MIKNDFSFTIYQLITYYYLVFYDFKSMYFTQSTVIFETITLEFS